MIKYAIYKNFTRNVIIYGVEVNVGLRVNKMIAVFCNRINWVSD